MLVWLFCSLVVRPKLCTCSLSEGGPPPDLPLDGLGTVMCLETESCVWTYRVEGCDWKQRVER